MPEGSYINTLRELAPLTQNGKIYLVQDTYSGLCYVRKSLHNYDTTVYAQLLAHPHPCLVRVVAMEEAEGCLTVLEEYINSITLEQYLAQYGPLAEAEVARIGLLLCDALHHLHTLPIPIIHRDVKLSNVLRTESGQIYLADYDTCRLYSKHADKDTAILGTAGYAAPEQFGFTQTDSRSDIYSLGVLLNLLLTGRHPQEQMAAGKLGPILQRCLAFNPQQRFESIAALKAALLTGRVDSKPGQKKPWRHIPGFRTGKFWKAALAVCGYLFITWISFAPNYSFDAPLMRAGFPILLFISGLCLVGLYTNLGGVWRHLPLLNRREWYSRAAGLLLSTLELALLYYVALTVLIKIAKWV